MPALVASYDPDVEKTAIRIEVEAFGVATRRPWLEGFGRPVATGSAREAS